jgi:micrococcal nuclease
MVGLNAPESRTRDLEEKKKGLAAKDRLKELLNKETFTLQSHGVGKYGRCLGELFVEDVNINKQLIEEGHAVEYHGGKR